MKYCSITMSIVPMKVVEELNNLALKNVVNKVNYNTTLRAMRLLWDSFRFSGINYKTTLMHSVRSGLNND